MVQIGKRIRRKVGFVDDGSPKPLYTRFHKNTFQRDLIDLGYYVDAEDSQPVKPDYHLTQGHYSANELPVPRSEPDALRQDLEEFGYCLVDAALSPEQLSLFQDRVDAQAAGERAADVGSYTSADVSGVPTNQFLLALVNKGQCFADAVEMLPRSVSEGELLEQLTTQMLGQGFICNSAAAAIAGPGGTPQALHCGQSMIPKPWPPWPYECFVGLFLDEFTAENGGTLVIPRSHRLLTEAGTDPLTDLPPTASVCAPAGTAMIMDGRLVHGTGANRSQALRRLVILTFHKPFIRQQEQWGLTLNKEIYANASPKLRQRLGFEAWHGGLGGFEGHGEGSVAPLRDDYAAVGELTHEGMPIQEVYLHHSKLGAFNQRQLAKMRETGQLIVKQDD